MSLIAAGAAWPQTAPPPSLGIQTPAQQAAPEPPALPQGEPSRRHPLCRHARKPRGLFNEMGKLFEKSLSIFHP